MMMWKDLGFAREESRKLQDSLRHHGDEIVRANLEKAKATADLASAQRLLRCCVLPLLLLTRIHETNTWLMVLNANAARVK